MIRTVISAGLVSLSLPLMASAQSVAVTNAKLWTGDELVEGATVVIQDGKVAAAGEDADVPQGLEVVDADGAWVTPGIFAPYTQIGIVEVGAEDTTNDAAAPMSSYGAALDMADAFNPMETTIPVTRIEGVTRFAVVPGFGSTLFGGQGFVADSSGDGDSITKPAAFTFINLGEGGAALSGGSRPAAWATLRAALVDARTYPARYIASDKGDALGRLDAQAFSAAAKGQQLILIAVDRASDIRHIIDLKADNPALNIALVSATEGWMVADELAEAEIPVIIDPYDNLPGSFETLGATQENAQRLIDAGVVTAISYFDDSTHQARLILQGAGNAVANGVDHEDALRAITSAPAEIFGTPELGSLEPGDVGDLVIWDGDPLEVMSAPTRIYIDGVEQSLESRQTELRDRYLDLDESEKPMAFKH
ncbi:amidohydrolase family protein [Henriciella aquimarina]|uniref:amidohydrolase family protein n=1 Tax=Henriciella aquimarina TaxID=545261 RepID=UPI000A03C110|nr:amidohydrolase family protein [Henriciella aquimarina]